ncbi:MAG: insulinase family protein [Pseudomonadales bacterium]
MLKSVFFRSRVYGFFLCSFFLLACAESNNADLQQPVKSPSDSRDYQYLEMANGLRVLLISDPEADKAAVSLNVEAGSKDDPVARPGLAHFLEHMLFLGTTKYPEPDGYQRFIGEHGGSHNAYTAFDNTNYFFDINADDLAEAIDRFAQFFLSPLLLEEYAEREKNAVNSEYMAYIKHDGRRYLDVLKQQMNPQHPFSKFTVGNLDTLAEQEGERLRDAAMKFYEQYYSANRMTLVVLGKEPLAELVSYAESSFGSIINRHLELYQVSQPLFVEGSLPKLVHYIPETELRQLSISFPVPDNSNNRGREPMLLIGDTLGHEGEGSLLQELKRRGWADGLSAGQGLSYRGGGLFGITVDLTEQGLASVDDVMALIFAQIELLRANGISESKFNEHRDIGAINFRFQEQQKGMGYVTRLSRNMTNYSSQNILRGPYWLDTYDEALIGQFLDALIIDNALVSISAKNLSAEQKSRYYQAEFSVKDLDVTALRSAVATVNRDALTMPGVNGFIPSQLDIVELIQAGEPVPVVNDLGVEAWFSQSESFVLPRATMLLELASPLAADTARHAVLTGLYARLVSDNLVAKTYPAMLVGFEQGISHNRRGLSLSVSGFNDKQDVLLEMLLEQLVALDFDAQRFADIKQEMIENWRNAVHRAPYKVLMSRHKQMFYQPYWSEQDLQAAIADVELADVVDFAREFLKDIKPRLLIHGNYSEAQVKRVLEKVAAAVPLSADGTGAAPASVLLLPEANNNWYAESLPHDDSAVIYYLQGEGDTNEQRVLMGLTAQIVKSAFFHSLRTEQQFGYIVFASPVILERTPGMVFVVQSPERSVAEITAAIELFIEEQHATLADMTEEEFARHRQALISALSEPAQNIGQQTGDYWFDLVHGYAEFDSKQQLVSALESLGLQQWQAFFGNYFQPAVQRKLVLYAPGKAGLPEVVDGVKIDDFDEFKAKLEGKNYP